MGSARRVTMSRRRAARLTGLALLSVAVPVAVVFLVLPLAVRGFVRLLDLTLNASMWLAASLSSGADGWTIAAAVARATGSLLLSPRVVTVVSGLVLVGALALYGLQQLLGSEEESSR